MTLDFRTVQIAKADVPTPAKVQRSPAAILWTVIAAVVMALCVVNLLWS